MPDITKRLEKAEKYLQKNRLDAAIEQYLAAWKEDPHDDEVAEIAADLYVRQNHKNRALECYGYLFDKHTERNDGSKAILVFRKMGKLGEQDPDRMLTVARFQEKQRPEEAQESYRVAAQTFLERGDQGKALEALRGLAALDDLNPDVHLQLGEVAESLGSKELAAGSLARAADLRRASQADGDDQTLALLERAQALAPSDGHVATALATVLFESGSPGRAAQLLEPLAAQGLLEVNRLLAQAHLATGNLARAEELLWGIAPEFPDAYQHLQRVTEGYLRQRNSEQAAKLLRKLKKFMFAAQKDRDFISSVEGLQQKGLAGVEVLEFLAELYNELNYDSLFSTTQGQLFDLHADAEEYIKAANALDRLVDVDPYDARNSERLQRLSGKLDPHRYQAIASRFQQAADTTAPVASAEAPSQEAGQSTDGEAESDVLEDLILQAEIFQQYGLKHRAVERLQRIARLFPGEEQRNEKLRSLCASAQFSPKPAPAAAAAPSGEPTATPSAEETLADITHVAEITRSIYREGTVKAVMSTAANEIGKTWQVSRCVAGLCTPGKPPSAVLEYCASGIPQSEVISIVKLVSSLVQLTADGNPLSVEDAAASAKLSKLAPVLQSLQIKSLLSLPMMETDQPIGIIVFEQCDRMRRWRSNDVVVLKALVDQTTIAISHVKLRSLMKTLAVADEGSGLLNRGSYLNALLSECGRAQKQRTPLSVLLLQFGRESQAARELEEAVVQPYVQEAAQVIMGYLRQNDIAIRYDTTTLALVLPDTKGKDTFFVVDKMRKMIGGVKMAGGDGLPMTAGIAEAFLEGDIDPVDSVTELINRLEQALEGAQGEGGGASKLLKPPLESSTAA